MLRFFIKAQHGRLPRRCGLQCFMWRALHSRNGNNRFATPIDEKRYPHFSQLRYLFPLKGEAGKFAQLT